MITGNTLTITENYLTPVEGPLDAKIYWNNLNDAINGIDNNSKKKGFKFVIKEGTNKKPEEYWFTEDYIPGGRGQAEFIPEPHLYLNETEPMSLQEFKQQDDITTGTYYIMNDSEPILDNYILDHIEIKPPNKTEYILNDILDLNGLKIQKVYKHNTSDSFIYIISYNFTTNLKNGTILDKIGSLDIIIDNNQELKVTITVTEN